MSKNRITFGDKVVKIAPKKKSIPPEQAGGWTPKQKAALERAVGEYRAWRKAFTATSCAPEDVPGRILAFRDRISKTIKNAKIRKFIIEMIENHYKISKATFKNERPSEDAAG